LICPRCAQENAALAKFCQECGQALARSCAACGAPLAEQARFCSQCGHAAPAAAAAAVIASTARAAAASTAAAAASVPSGRAAGAQAPARPAERRQATVVFADIAGYTQLCARLDAEHVQALLNRFYEAMDGAVAVHGGIVIDHAGDGVLAVFGAPVAHGNDTERAVRAALAMQAAAAQIVEPVSARALALHIGITSGEVVAAMLEGGATPKYTVTGDAVNLAARLDALAGAGETLVSASVQRDVAALFDSVDLGEKPVKGYAAPVRVHRITAPRSTAVERLPLVGRQAELRQLEGALESLLESGAGAAILIRGDPGMGKSRLVEELVRRAQARGCACHVGRVLDFGIGAHHEALPRVLAELLGLPAHASQDERRAALAGTATAGAPLEAEQDAMVRDLLGLEQQPELRSWFDAMDNATRLRRGADACAALAARAARAQPRLLVFEDIHWASPLLLGCLAALTMATRQHPLLLAMTSRFEGDPLDRAWRSASHGTPLLTLDIGPLTPAEAKALAGGLVQSSERFATQCIERAEGHPLFLEQLLRNALEAEGSGMPPTIQSLVLARMDRLPVRDKLALQAASVIGKRFSLEALGFLLDDPGYRCDTLLAADLVRPESGDFLFAHALIQEGVYASLLHARKRQLHERAAAWYEGREAALHAEHLDRAQRPAEARLAYLRAAQAEAQRYRYDEAQRLAQRGAALPREADAGAALELLQGDLLRELARTDESIRAFEEALERAGDDGERCRARLGIAAGHRVTGDIPRALQALDAAQPIAEALGDSASRSRIHSLRGNLCFASGRVDVCGREHALALEHARRAHDVEAEALASSGLGDHAYAEGRMLTALGHFRHCVELCRQAGLLRAEIVNTCMVGHCLNWGGDGEGSLREIRAAVALSARLGMPQTEVMALESLGMTLTLRGAFEEAEPFVDRAIVAARQASSRRFLSVDLMLKARCLGARGRRAEARAACAEAIELAHQTGIGFLGASLYAVMSMLSDEAAERRRWLAEGEALLAGDCLAHARLMFYRDAIDVALQDGRPDDALRYADGLERCMQAEPVPASTIPVARARALVRRLRHGPDAAVDAELRDLAEQARQSGFVWLVPGTDTALAAGPARP
jgi:class 3 adenylate cyclase/tetratricopeptide (TPR) repeat protein